MNLLKLSRIRPLLPLLAAWAIACALLAFAFASAPLLSSGDDLNTLSPYGPHQDFFDWVWKFYSQGNGRLGEILTAVVWKKLNEHFMPELYTYPWWGLKAFSYFLLGGAVLLWTDTALELAFPGNIKGRAAYLALALIGTALHPDLCAWISENALMLESYTLPAFLLGLCLRAILSGFKAGRLTPWAWMLLLFSFISHEQLFFAGSVILGGALILAPPKRQKVLWVNLLGISTATLLIFLLSPGQGKRNATAGGFHPNLWRWIEEFSKALSEWIPLHGFVLIVLTSVLLLASSGIAVRAMVRKLKSQQFAAGQGEWISLFFLASWLSSLTSFVSTYYPDRARIIPVLCLTCAICILVRALMDSRKRTKRVQVLGYIVLIGLGLIRLPQAVSAWAARRALDETRGVSYLAAFQVLKESAPSRVELTRCPVSMDAIWGLRAAESWYFHSETDPNRLGRLILDGTNDSELGPEHSLSTQIVQCKLMWPRFTLNPYVLGTTLSPVATTLSIQRIGTRKLAHLEYVFPFTPELRICSGWVSYNPHVAWSPYFRETRGFELLFHREGHPSGTLSVIEIASQTASNPKDGTAIDAYTTTPTLARSGIISSSIRKPEILPPFRRLSRSEGFWILRVSGLEPEYASSAAELQVKCTF